MLSPLTRTLVLCSLVAVMACSGQSGERNATDSSDQSTGTSVPASNTQVTGQIRSTPVTLTQAEFDGNLSIFAGDGWGFNPSLLIFLFLEDDTPPENRTFTVSAADGMQASNPHVHYRWLDASDQIDVDIASQSYDLTLEFGAVQNGSLSGRIEFSVPGEETSVSGPFRAQITE